MANSATANNSDVPAIKGRASLKQVAAHTPERLITYRISVLAQALSRLVDASVQRDLGLTSRQWRMLVILNRLGTSPSGEVARMANFDHSQVSRVAFELAEKGFVTQTSDPEDRRRQILALTPKALESLRDGIPVSLQRETRLRSRLSAADYDVFVRVLEALGDEAGVILDEIRRGD
jgi:DNA-binding MarR family transcriptional regulator